MRFYFLLKLLYLVLSSIALNSSLKISFGKFEINRIIMLKSNVSQRVLFQVPYVNDGLKENSSCIMFANTVFPLKSAQLRIVLFKFPSCHSDVSLTRNIKRKMLIAL